MTATDITLRPRQPDDDARNVKICNLVQPPFPPFSVEELRHEREKLPEGAHPERYVAEQSGRIVGYHVLEEWYWLQQPGGYGAEIVVDPAKWGQGIGSRLYDLCLQHAREHEATRLS